MELADRLIVALDALGAVGVVELHGGHQSRVFRVDRIEGAPIVAKLLDAATTERDEVAARVAVVEAVAAIDRQVCGPIAVDGRWVGEIVDGDGRGHVLVCSEWADGRAPDPASASDATAMGAGLARLHEALARLPPTDLPVVAALRASPIGDDVGEHQVLHGDFGVGNVRLSDAGLRIFDFDDCGFGPPVHDVANAVYLVGFDGVVHGTPEIAERFRAAFVAAYREASGRPLPDDLIDAFVERRVRALGTWLDDLTTAPPGIRDASPTWLATLRSFVDGHRPSGT